MLLSNLKNNKKEWVNNGAQEATNYAFVLSNKHFFNGTHKSISIIAKKPFIAHCGNLTKRQFFVLAAVLESLNNNGIKHVSQPKQTKKDKLNYVTIIFDYKGKTHTENVFTITNFNKLMSYRGLAKFNLSLSGLLKLANQK
jgi:hypothetical protein